MRGRTGAFVAPDRAQKILRQNGRDFRCIFWRQTT